MPGHVDFPRNDENTPDVPKNPVTVSPASVGAGGGGFASVRNEREECNLPESFYRLLEVAEAFLKRKATIGELRRAVIEAKKAQGEA
ncbi:MAG: hypothetical protein BWY80_01215 [Firmicutes bacterium ADurb.Bin456]|nr:MAG: hypothetical protein BWY80_01215 [Firmicutes bacterium ADurb.Bin456]